jgi:hypothetical protein
MQETAFLRERLGGSVMRDALGRHDRLLLSLIDL